MNIENLSDVFNGEPVFRLKQAKQAVFKDLIGGWKEAGGLPLSLREKLNKECPLEIKADIFSSRDVQSRKASIFLKDGLMTETVLMGHQGGRNTVCVSSQVGCPGGCLFCTTGQTGFKRNLTCWEIVEQVLLWARYLKERKGRVNNAVFMGMGEPLLNYDNVLEAVKVLNGKDGLNLGIRHISISTVGIPDKIRRLAKEKIKPNLALSLHAPNDFLRSKIIPLNKKYPLAVLSKALKEYIQQTRQRVMFEYLLLNGYNDSDKFALELAKFVKQFKKPLGFSKARQFHFVNLISYNPLPAAALFKPSSPERLKSFKALLEKNGIEVVQRYKFGQDIKAACGQLTAGL